MRYIRDIPNPSYKISLYRWNGKYIIKIEAGGMYEQIFKLEETEVASDEELDAVIDAEFLKQTGERFQSMHTGFYNSLKRHEIVF